MKLRLILISILISAVYLTSFGKEQTNDYVTFVVESLDGKTEQLIHYPAGTTYKVYLTKKNKETIKSDNAVIYEGDVHLTIYPSYRKFKSEEFTIEQKRLRIYTTAEAAALDGFGDNDYDHPKVEKKKKSQQPKKEKAGSSNNIFAEKILSSSEVNQGKYNIKLSFSNGVVFNYIDGKFNATQNDKYLDIKGRYLIQANDGILKVSFHPSSGETWWVFEEKKAE